jgi:Lrp/AsnC family transcriptional regulator, leucine-responsive regulatory protein
MEINSLDVKDQRIIAELDKNSRQSNAQIGKKVRLSKEVVKYRIDNLIEKGIILRFHTVTNYFKLGIYKFKLYLRLKNVNQQKLEEMAKFFQNNKKTEWVVNTTGRWDFIIGFLLKNVNEFDDEIQIIFNKFSEYIQERAVTTTLYLAHHAREFLSERTKQDKLKVVYHTSKDKQEKIDEIDEKILILITNNARMSVVEIAKKINKTPRIVQYRIRELERKKIILAYKVQIDPRKMGRIFCKMIVYLVNTTEENINQFVDYASSIPGSVWPQRVMGAWDFELDFEIQNYDLFQEIILDLKEKFPDIISNHEFCIVSKEFKLDFYPGAIKSSFEK